MGVCRSVMVALSQTATGSTPVIIQTLLLGFSITKHTICMMQMLQGILPFVVLFSLPETTYRMAISLSFVVHCQEF